MSPPSCRAGGRTGQLSCQLIAGLGIACSLRVSTYSYDERQAPLLIVPNRRGCGRSLRGAFCALVLSQVFVAGSPATVAARILIVSVCIPTCQIPYLVSFIEVFATQGALFRVKVHSCCSSCWGIPSPARAQVSFL